MKETGPLYDILSGYLSEKEGSGYKEATVYVHKRYLLQFCHLLEGLGIQDFAAVSMDEIKKIWTASPFINRDLSALRLRHCAVFSIICTVSG